MSEWKAALVTSLQQVNKKLEEISTFIQEEFIKAGAGKIERTNKWRSSNMLYRIKIPKRDFEHAVSHQDSQKRTKE